MKEEKGKDRRRAQGLFGKFKGGPTNPSSFFFLKKKTKKN